MAHNVQSSIIPADGESAAEEMLLQVRALSSRKLSSKPGGAANHAGNYSDISFQVEPHDLVVLTGPGGEAKTRLLRTLAGLERKPGGEIRINGVDLYAYRKLFAPYIGYVPPWPGLHQTLTVNEVLEYTARLRLPNRTPKDARRQRVHEVLHALDLEKQAGLRISALSSGQQYRASVAVEMIPWPGILLLDAPAERMELAEEIQLSRLLKAIAQQGPVVIQSTEVARCAQIADKVLVLAGDGTLAWFGPGDAALDYFQGLAGVDASTAGASTSDAFTFEQVLDILSGPCDNAGNDNGSTIDTWQKRFQASPAYATYVDDPLNDKYPDLLLQNRPLERFRSAAREKNPPKKVPQSAARTQCAVFVRRTLRVLGRERMGLWLLLAPLLVALSDFVVASPYMLDPLLGDPVRVPVALGLLVFLEMLVAALIFHNAVVKERLVYQRERRVLSLSAPYALSKVWLVVLLALYQGVLWSAIHFFASGMAGGLANLPAVWVTLSLVALTGGILGLIASSLARSAPAAILLSIALVTPQFLLSGSVLPLPRLSAPAQALSMVNPSRYAFETLLTLSGYGQDVARDACWQIPEVMRNALSDADKQKCICLGDNIFSKCQFPGIHKFFSFVIEQPPPAQPTPESSLSSLPPQPTPAPGQSVTQFAQAVNAYSQQLDQFHTQAGAYSDSLQQYAQNLAAWQRARAQVTGNAEGVIAQAIQQYGQGFQVDPLRNWMILLGMSVVLMILLVGIQPRKGYEV